MSESHTVSYFYNDDGERVIIRKKSLSTVIESQPYFEKAIDWIFKSYPELKGHKLYEQVDGVEFVVWPPLKHSGWSLSNDLKSGQM